MMDHTLNAYADQLLPVPLVLSHVHVPLLLERSLYSYLPDGGLTLPAHPPPFNDA